MRKTLLILLVIITGYSYGQNVRTITLNEAMAIAEKNNPELKIALYDQMKAEYKVKEVYAENLIPTITLNSNYTRSFKKQVFEIFGEKFEIGSDNSITNTFQISEPIPILGTPVFTGIRIAEYYERLQTENVLSVRSKIRSDVKKAFFNVLLLEEVINVNENSIMNARENLRVVEARYNAGVALEFDFIRAKVKVDNLNPTLEQARNNLEIAKEFLKNTMGITSEEDLDVTGGLDYDSVEVWGTTDQLVEAIARNNVAVRQLKLGKLINEQLIEIEEATYMPRLYLFANYSISASENDDKSISRYRFINSMIGGIGLNWDLNFPRKNHRLEQSKIEVRKSEEQIRNISEKLRTQSRSIVLRMEDARNRIISQSLNVDQANRGLGLARTGFISGVVNQIDVLDAELLVSQVRLGYIQAIYDYLIARTDLEQLLER